MSRWIGLAVGAALAALAVACGEASIGYPTRSVVTGTPPTNVPQVRVPSRLRLNDTSGFFVGRRVSFSITPQMVQSRDASAAVVTTSNASVVRLLPPAVVAGNDGKGLQVNLELVTTGTATVHVSSGEFDDSLVLSVPDLPPLGNALAVDSFTVLEYQTCATCAQLVYLPVLRLREPTGAATAAVVGVQFTASEHPTPLCWGTIQLGPGTSEQINRIHPYLWSNDLLFVSLDGVPFSSRQATARVIVRAANGSLSRLEVTGSIVRVAPNPVLPLLTADFDLWGC